MVNQLDISAESLRTFENFYQKRVSEAGGAREDHEELEIAKDILMVQINSIKPPAERKRDAFEAQRSDVKAKIENEKAAFEEIKDLSIMEIFPSS